jgi:hypothetical protein
MVVDRFGDADVLHSRTRPLAVRYTERRSSPAVATRCGYRRAGAHGPDLAASHVGVRAHAARAGGDAAGAAGQVDRRDREPSRRLAPHSPAATQAHLREDRRALIPTACWSLCKSSRKKNQKAPIYWTFAEPSEGLEPSTPSLPSSNKTGKAGKHGKQRARKPRKTKETAESE